MPDQDPPPQVECTWVWLGFTMRWVRAVDCPMCPAGSACSPPPLDGTYIGEPGVSACEAL